MHLKLRLALDLLPKCPLVMIAGGAAVDYDKASDIDVFFCKNNLPAALKFIDDLNGTILPKPNPYGKHSTFLVGEIIGQLDKKIQVVVSIHNTPSETIDDFDISTHMLGYLHSGNKIVGKMFTPTTASPEVWHVKDKTGERYLKICERYGHIPQSVIMKMIEAELKLQKLDLEA